MCTKHGTAYNGGAKRLGACQKEGGWLAVVEARMEVLLEAVDVQLGAMATLMQALTQAGGQEAFEALAAQCLALCVLVEERLAQLKELQ